MAGAGPAAFEAEVELESAGVGDDLHQGMGVDSVAEEVEVVGECHKMLDKRDGAGSGNFVVSEARGHNQKSAIRSQKSGISASPLTSDL